MALQWLRNEFLIYLQAVEDALVFISRSFPRGTVLPRLSPGCHVNHFPRDTELTHKDRLAVTCRDHVSGVHLPRTFVLPEETEAFHDACDRLCQTHWVLKPCNAGEARGIAILSSESARVATIRKVGMKAKRIVACQYVDRPMTVCGFKCDMRLYVLLISDPPVGNGVATPADRSQAIDRRHPLSDVSASHAGARSYRAYIYREGLVRPAAGKYEPLARNGVCAEDDTILLSHVTNNSLTTRVRRDVHERNMPLATILQAFGAPWFSAAWASICHLAASTIDAGLVQMWPAVDSVDIQYPEKRLGFFELFGFDVLLDVTGFAWLMEVNSMPDISGTSVGGAVRREVAYAIKSHLLADMFSLLQLHCSGAPSEESRSTSHFNYDQQN
eukprot:Opistho-2@42647